MQFEAAKLFLGLRHVRSQSTWRFKILSPFFPDPRNSLRLGSACWEESHLLGHLWNREAPWQAVLQSKVLSNSKRLILRFGNRDKTARGTTEELVGTLRQGGPAVELAEPLERSGKAEQILTANLVS